jgi:hypothetical protein
MSDDKTAQFRVVLFAIYISGIQPGVRVPPGVREDILGGTYNLKIYIYYFMINAE